MAHLPAAGRIELSRLPVRLTARGPEPLLAAGLAGAIGIAFLAPGDGLGTPRLCPFWLLTGIPCPGCGLTRSWILATHGDWGAAFAMHAIGPISFVAAVLALVALVVALVLRRAAWLRRPLLGLFVTLCLATGVFGVWRWALMLSGDWNGPV